MGDNNKFPVIGILRGISTPFGEVKSREISGQAYEYRDRYTEWGFTSLEDLEHERQEVVAGTYDPEQSWVQRLEPGMLVTVFNTVSEGEVLWEGEIELEWKRRYTSYPLNPDYGQQEVFGMWVHGFEKTLDPKEWASMFFGSFPARLERDGKTIYGKLDPHFETGTEGVIWSIYEYGKSGYDALQPIKDGDRLTVYKGVTGGDVERQDRLSFKESVDPQDIRLTHITIQAKRIPEHMDPEEWQGMFWGNRLVRIEPE